MIKSPAKIPTSVRFHQQQIEDLEECSLELDRSVSYLIRAAVDRYLANQYRQGSRSLDAPY